MFSPLGPPLKIRKDYCGRRENIRVTILAGLSSLQGERSKGIIPSDFSSRVLGSEIVVKSDELSLVGGGYSSSSRDCCGAGCRRSSGLRDGCGG